MGAMRMGLDGSPEFSFRSVDEQSLGRFREMFEACFGLRVDESYFRWKYLDNPAGKVVAYEALDGERPAAFYGVIPEIWKFNGAARTIYQSMDTATHPSYQRRGLFVKLAKLTYDYVMREGETTIVGFPGGQSYPGFVNKLGWKHVHDLELVFTQSTLFRLMHLGRPAARLDFEVVERKSEDLARFLLQFSGITPLVKQLSPEFVDWRVFRHPLLRYVVVLVRSNSTVVGCCIYREDTPRSCCVEWLGFSDPALYDPYVPAVISYVFRASGRRYVYTWEPTEQRLRRAYRRAGLIRNRTSRGPFTDRFPFIVYRSPSVANDPWFVPLNYDLQPLSHD